MVASTQEASGFNNVHHCDTWLECSGVVSTVDVRKQTRTSHNAVQTLVLYFCKCCPLLHLHGPSPSSSALCRVSGQKNDIGVCVLMCVCVFVCVCVAVCVCCVCGVCVCVVCVCVFPSAGPPLLLPQTALPIAGPPKNFSLSINNSFFLLSLGGPFVECHLRSNITRQFSEHA